MAGEIVLSWVKCKACGKEFPVVANAYDLNSLENLELVPAFCPFCGLRGSLDFTDLKTDYYG